MRVRAIWILAILAGIALLAGLYNHMSVRGAPATNGGAKSSLMLMTSLPLIWGEAQSMEEMLSGDTTQHPFYTQLSQDYDVTPTDSLVEGGYQLAVSNPDVLLLAQPRPLTPEELVAVDGWVRSGGRALIFADPMLRMESRYPIGDKRRPQAVSLMTPLFKRWGLDFVFDEVKGTGPITLEAGPHKILAVDVGGYVRRAKQDITIADCQVGSLAVMARCDIGKGRVILVADADMLDNELMARSDNGAFVAQLLQEVQMDADKSK